MHRIFAMSLAKVYPAWAAKVERKGRARAELDEVIAWLTGYDAAGLGAALSQGVTLERFFLDAPRMNPARDLVTGVICGVRVGEIDDPLMRDLRVLDKLVDELAKGRPLAKVLRQV
ncbi:MAG: DUF2200 domain-containing protein [Tabrizicola sp.]